MIIVTGSVTVRPEHLAAALRSSLEHVQRSRLEPGCLLHSVHQDVEAANRLVFLEHWRDREALLAHFAVPASQQFVTEVAGLADAAPAIEIYEATTVSL
jgi:quinol monooxygenase YgiN